MPDDAPKDRSRTCARAVRGAPLIRRPASAEVEEELMFHIEMRTRELVVQGLSPDDARAGALRAFGDLESISTECTTLGDARNRHHDRREWFAELRQDVAYAIRQLANAPAFTIIAVFTLALGIGATTAIFSAVESVVLRPFPFAHPQRVVTVSELWPGNNGSVSDGNFVDWYAKQTAFDKLAAEQFAEFTLSDQTATDRVVGGRVTKDFFGVFGVRPALGRTFQPEEDEPGRDAVVVLSNALWRTRFGADPAVVGRAVELNGRKYTSIGVMPASFGPTTSGEQLWVPQAFSPERKANHDQHHNIVIGLLRTDVPASDAQTQLTAIQKELDERYPNANFNGTVGVQPFDVAIVGDYRTRLFVTLGAVTFVLIIACGNVANLLLARGTARAKELAVRAALGAGRERILRQLLTESGVLGLAGGLAGLALAYGGVRVLIASAPVDIPRLDETRVDSGVLVFALTMALLASILFGLAPAIRASKQDVPTALRESGRSPVAVRDRMRQTLVAAEVALACALLAGAGVLVRTALSLQDVKPGFDPSGVVTARVTLPETRYRSPAAALEVFHTIGKQLETLPGMKAVALGSTAPLVGGDFTNGVNAEGQTADAEHLVQAASRFVAPGYLATIRIPVLRGRDFTSADVDGAQRVAIVSEKLASRVWPNENPIGRRFRCCDGTADDPRWKTVIGIVGDVHADGPGAELQPEFYIPLDQMAPVEWEWTHRTMTVVARGATTDEAQQALMMASIRTVVRSVDPAIAVYQLRPMNELIRGSTAEARFNALLLSLLGAAGLVLAMVGIYGVVAYLVTQRAPEIGLRMALGASTGDVLRLLTVESTPPIVLGVAAGVALALMTMRLLRTVVVGVSLNDPTSIVAAATVLCAAGLVATLVPALRATRGDPAQSIMRR